MGGGAWGALVYPPYRANTLFLRNHIIASLRLKNNCAKKNENVKLAETLAETGAQKWNLH